MGVAARYFRAAGFASGRYEGSTPVLLASINDPTTKLMARLVERSLRRMGFDVRNVPIVRSKDVAAVPNPGIAGWDLASTSLR